jgi:phi13 family phage major tail protein
MNKVKYGLKSVYYATATIAADGSATYETPVAWPGAVSLSLDASGEVTKFRADNINYWIGQANNGYSGDFESALVPDSFKKDVLGYVEDGNGVLIESVDAATKPFALLFQFEGDETETRHVLYYCTASRPSVSGQTTEETIEPQTETISIETGSVYNAGLGVNIAKASAKAADTPYATWFEAVYLPTNNG